MIRLKLFTFFARLENLAGRQSADTHTTRERKVSMPWGDGERGAEKL
jgi:hypothetical protein